MIDVGIVGVGTYLPEKTMKAAEIARLTNGVWSEDAVINKLGIKQRYLPGPDDGTQEMGAKAALKCLENTGVDPKEKVLPEKRKHPSHRERRRCREQRF